MRSKIVSGCVLVVAMVLSSCSGSGQDQVAAMTEMLVRTAAATQGQVELAAVGVEVSGPLACSTQMQGDAIAVTCTATSLDGRPVTVSGTATSLPGGTTVSGSFVGTAAGTQVFAKDCLGC
jgi:hypothetical protein